MRFFPALSACLLLLIGCDAATPTTDCPGAITAVAEAPELLLLIGEDPLRLAPDTLGFRHSLGDSLAFTARSTDPAVADVQRTDDGAAFVLTPATAGTARLEITAEDACGLRHTVPLSVRVADACAAASDPDLAVFFPVEAGRTWTFDYHRDKGPDMTSPAAEYTGTVVWEIVEASSCQRGRQGFRLRETATGTVTFRPGGDDVVQDWQQQRTLDGRLDGRRLVIEDYTDEVPAAAWLRPAPAPDTLVVTAEQGRIPETYGVTAWEVHLARGTGLTFWQRRYHGKRAERDVITLRRNE